MRENVKLKTERQFLEAANESNNSMLNPIDNLLLLEAFDLALQPTEDPANDANPFIWHFTSPDALFEILKPDGCLFATHMAFLNDRHETHLVQDVLSLLRDHIDILGQNDIENKDHFCEQVRNGTVYCPFVTCFCNEVESPLMWRVYTRGGGFAIGFHKKELLENVLCPDGFGFRYDYCRYWNFSEELIKERKRTLQSKISDYESSHPNNRPLFESEHTEVETQFLEEILALQTKAAFIKDSFFSDEKEFRLVFTKKGGLSHSDFEMVNGGPRLRIRFKEHLHRFVSEIKVSPLGDADENLKAARFAAGVFRIDPRKVSMFKCPVRE